MTTTDFGEPVLCVDCGTTNDARAQTCWLCGQILGPSTTVRVPHAPTSAPARGVDWASEGIVVALIVALIVVGVGLGAVQPGFLIPYVLIAMPALIAIKLVKSHRRPPQHPLSPAQKVLDFIVSAVMVAGVMVGIVVTVFIGIALLIGTICLFSTAGGFH